VPDAALAAVGAAVSRLRSRLAGQVPVLPGRLVVRDRAGVTRLDPAVVTADVAAFARGCATARAAARAGRSSEAVAAHEAVRAWYRGHLLATPGYPWVYDPGEDGVSLDEQYRQLQRDATAALAGLYDDAGGHARAAPLYEELPRADPTDAAAAQQPLRGHLRLDDRAALERAYRDLAAWARAALGGDEDEDGSQDREGGAGDAAGASDPLDSATVRFYETLRSDLERRAASGGTGGAASPALAGRGAPGADSVAPAPTTGITGSAVRAA
jgi:DNA-binding SARP family transcriptional activator